MKARILFVTDLHKRMNESMSIKGGLDVQDMIQEDIIAFCENKQVTHVVIAGDWYHRGYNSIGPALSDMEMDKKLSAAINGNVYLVVGNHFYMERDNNPEMYIIQPCEYIRPQGKHTMPKKPVFNVTNHLRIGNVQVSFFHYSKLQKDYYEPVENGVTYHIGVYHDDICVPGYISEIEGYVTKTSSSYLERIYSNIDLAIHGHLHVKHGIVPIELATGKKVPLIIPGSLGITNSAQKFRHADVELPVVTIGDDNNVSVAVASFKTHLDQLRFYETKKKEKKAYEAEGVIPETMPMFQTSSARSLKGFVNELGYSNKRLRLIDIAAKGPVMLPTAVHILTEVEAPDGDSNSIS